MNAFGLRIHDTWWMTETGGQVICNYPCMEIRPGSMGKPIPGVKARLLIMMEMKCLHTQWGT